jgi:predicted PurR-regulated permease PerM
MLFQYISDMALPIPRYWLYSILLIILAGVIWYLRQAIAPLVIASLIAYVLNPLVDALEQRLRLNRTLAIFLVFLACLGITIALPSLMLPVLVDEIQNLSKDLERLLALVQNFFSQKLVVWQWEFNLGGLIPEPKGLLNEQLASLPENLFHIIEATTVNLIWSLVILVTTYYLLKDYPRLRDGLFHLAPEAHRNNLERLYQEIKQVWNGYLRGNLALMAIVGVAFTLVWLGIGLPGAVILGLLTGILTIIPDLGPAIAAGLAIIVALLEGSNTLPISNFWFALLVLGIYLLLVNIKSIWLRPRIYGHSMHMHEGIVFVAIMIAVVVQGILGALIVVPVLASFGVIARVVYHSLTGQPLWPEDAENAENSQKATVQSTTDQL